MAINEKESHVVKSEAYLDCSLVCNFVAPSNGHLIILNFSQKMSIFSSDNDD